MSSKQEEIEMEMVIDVFVDNLRKMPVSMLLNTIKEASIQEATESALNEVNRVLKKQKKAKPLSKKTKVLSGLAHLAMTEMDRRFPVKT